MRGKTLFFDSGRCPVCRRARRAITQLSIYPYFYMEVAYASQPVPSVSLPPARGGARRRGRRPGGADHRPDRRHHQGLHRRRHSRCHHEPGFGHRHQDRRLGRQRRLLVPLPDPGPLHPEGGTREFQDLRAEGHHRPPRPDHHDPRGPGAGRDQPGHHRHR